MQQPLPEAVAECAVPYIERAGQRRVGIGRDRTRYYRRTVTVVDASNRAAASCSSASPNCSTRTAAATPTSAAAAQRDLG